MSSSLWGPLFGKTVVPGKCFQLQCRHDQAEYMTCMAWLWDLHIAWIGCVTWLECMTWLRWVICIASVHLESIETGVVRALKNNNPLTTNVLLSLPHVRSKYATTIYMCPDCMRAASETNFTLKIFYHQALTILSIAARFSYEAPLWWHAVTYGIQLDALTIGPELHHKYQTYDTCIRVLEFSEKIPGLRWESNPHLHNSGGMLYHLSY